MRKALYLVAAGIPIVTTSAGLRGVLEAQQRFRAVNAVRILIGTLGFVAPVAVLHYSAQLTGSIGALVATRAIGWVSYVVVCTSTSPRIFSSLQIRWGTLRQLLRYGGWLTVSNIISPLLVSMDRFMIAGILSVGVVAYYTTPSEIAGKILAIPIALQIAIFPAFSGTAVAMDPNRAALYQHGAETIFIVLYPSTIIAVLFAHDVLRIWLGASFASASSTVLQILAVGVLINGLAHVPSAMLQASGRPDLTAKLHLVELPAYTGLVWWLTSRYGIQGTAVAWAVRVGADAVLLFFLASKIGVPVPLRGRSLAAAVATITICLFLSNVNVPIALRALATVGLTIGCICTIRPLVTNLARA
jgi:O-antigen/teichoic acid export membrane protein